MISLSRQSSNIFNGTVLTEYLKMFGKMVHTIRGTSKKSPLFYKSILKCAERITIAVNHDRKTAVTARNRRFLLRMQVFMDVLLR